MLFGKKKPDGKTLLLLDIEQGSVGSALLRVSPGEPLKLFGETRVSLRVLPTRDAITLLRETRGAIREALAHAAQVGSRLRNVPAQAQAAGVLRDIGEISHAAVFLGAPWGVPNLESGIPAFIASMSEAVESALEESLGSLPHTFYTATGGIMAGASRVLSFGRSHTGEAYDTYLLALVGGELSELVLFSKGAAAGYASAPVGRHTLVRTLRAHGLSDEETRSVTHLDINGPVTEALVLAARHFAVQLADAAAPLLARVGARRVWVLAQGAAADNASEWFARALTASGDFNALFPQGGELRALKAAYVTPYIAAHEEFPDLRLSLQALYGDGLF